MIAQRLSTDILGVVVGVRAYLARFGELAHPGDLAVHRRLWTPSPTIASTAGSASGRGDSSR